MIWWRHMSSGNLVNTVSGNGLLSVWHEVIRYLRENYDNYHSKNSLDSNPWKRIGETHESVKQTLWWSFRLDQWIFQDVLLNIDEDPWPALPFDYGTWHNIHISYINIHCHISRTCPPRFYLLLEIIRSTYFYIFFIKYNTKLAINKEYKH